MILIESSKVKSIKEMVRNNKVQAEMEGRFSLFHTKDAEEKFSRKMDFENCRRIYNKIIEHDNECKLPYNVGLALDRYTVGNRLFYHSMNLFIDKDSDKIPDDRILYSIMQEGLININKDNSSFIKCNMSSLDDIDDYISLIFPYDKSGFDFDTIILAGFPQDYIDLDGNLVGNTKNEDVYDTSFNTPRVRPDFMLGAIIKRNNGLWDFYSKDKIIKNMEKGKQLIR